MKLTCTLTGASPDYGTVYVDENMNLIHAPAEADANDTLHLENCILSVETPNNEYHLDGNVLSVVRHRLNGSMTAEAWVYTAAPEKLVEFKYNHQGFRIQKDITKDHHTISVKYHLYDRFITRVEFGTEIADIQYDEHMRPVFIKLHDRIYNYIYNLQNDIVGIANEHGKLVVEYRYNTWGSGCCERVLDSAIACLNPYGFRGYAYDSETNLLYLNNRYYNCEAQRFINADLFIGIRDRLIDHNLFAYCKNDCVNKYDPNGNSAIVVGAIGSGILSLTSTVNWPGVFQTLGNIFQQGSMAFLGALNIQSSSNEVADHADAAIQEAEAENSRREIVFPQTPAEFLPIGLEIVTYPGTKNGMFIHYKDPVSGDTIFRWDENTTYPNGPHYHIIAKEYEGYHFYPGDIIPEPYATTYFGGA